MEKFKMLIFILGGIRSGKTIYAGEIAKNAKNVIYIATYVNDKNDKEMIKRIERHKKLRPKNWKIFEIGNFSEIKRKISEFKDATIIIDCLTLLVSNFIFENKDADEEKISVIVENFVKEIKKDNKIIIISNEVGHGIIPENEISRRYIDLLGRANEIIAKECDEFYYMVAGIPIKVK